MDQKRTKANMQLVDLKADRPNKTRSKANPVTVKRKKATVGTVGKNSKSVRRKKNELQMIGKRPDSRNNAKVIRADVITNLDIIGEEKTCIRKNRTTQIQVSEKNRRRQKKRRKAIRLRIIFGICILILIAVIGMLIKSIYNRLPVDNPVSIMEDIFPNVQEVAMPDIVEDFLDVNEYSRPGEAIGKVKNIFVHYTANPGTSAMQNRSYFQSLAETGERAASAHFIIGYDGEIIQCIPLDEIACAVIDRNYDSISIECCYQDEDGHFTESTYESLLQLTTWLLEKYNLSEEDVLRHYDASGKLCPKYYVDYPEAWDTFKANLQKFDEGSDSFVKMDQLSGTLVTEKR